MLQSAITNWKTTLAGVLLIGLSGLHLIGVNIPGVNPPDIATALTTAIGLIMAKDAVTAATK